MTTNFARAKHQWLDQVAADAALVPLAFKVAYRLAAYVNQETGDAWPSQSRLAEECHVSHSGLRKAVRALVDGGHLEVTPGAGRIHTSRYRWTMRTAETCHRPNTFSSEIMPPQGHVEAENVSLQEHVYSPNLSPEKQVPGGHVSPQGHPTCPPSDTQRVPGVTTNNTNEQYQGTISLRTADAAGSDPTDIRTNLFRDGLKILVAASGRTEGSCRSLIGKWLRDNGDDAKRVLRAIEDARDERAAEPAAWIEAALKQRRSRRQPSTDSVDFAFERF